MVHDDDTGRRVELPILTSSSNTDRPSRFITPDKPPVTPDTLPSLDVQSQIRQWAKSPGVDVERIYARLRRTRHDITRDMIRYILEQPVHAPRKP